MIMKGRNLLVMKVGMHIAARGPTGLTTGQRLVYEGREGVVYFDLLLQYCKLLFCYMSNTTTVAFMLQYKDFSEFHKGLKAMAEYMKHLPCILCFCML